MTHKILFVTTALTIFLVWGCNTKPQESNSTVITKTDTVVVSQGINSKGIGRFKDVPLTHPLDGAMAEKGKAIYGAKCGACHKLTEEKLVGPGWKGITDKRTPEWVMNFITNTSVMLDKDLSVQAEIITCVVRMPSQDLTDAEAREIFEFMRQNDGKN